MLIPIGNFFFKYRNILFPLFAFSIAIPSPDIFQKAVFGSQYYLIPMITGLVIALTGQIIRAATIGLKYIIRGGKDKKVYACDLVTEGIFNHCRNPLYVGNIMMLTGVGLISNSVVFLVIILPFFLFIYQTIVLAEESYLTKKFGANYSVYCKNVNRWIPNPRGLKSTFSSFEFDWNRYILNEYNTIYLLFLAIFIVLLFYSPPFIELNQKNKTELTVTVFLILSGMYLFVRYLKKSKRLVSKSFTS